MGWLRTFSLVIFTLFLITSVTHQSYVTRFENRRYSGIIVSIHEDVPEDVTIIQQLKDIFTNASKALYKATHRRAFFGDVVIEIPKTWSVAPSYQYAPGKSLFSSSSFRIAEANPKFKDTPYTLQASGCGQPGQYIHLTPAFILNENEEISNKYGSLARQIIHEWAHYRYGVFDEYGEAGSKKFPSFYIDDSGNVRPTTCQEGIKGWLSSSDGGPCSILEGELLPDDDCRFIPDEDRNNATSSLMYSVFLSSINQFCDNSTKNLHNRKAPNKHNNLCQYKSTWEVISQHEDFLKQKSPFDEVNTTVPNFRIIHRKKNETSTFVLALDVSGSMRQHMYETCIIQARVSNSNAYLEKLVATATYQLEYSLTLSSSVYDRINILHATASRFIHHRVQNGSYLGIVSFSKKTEQLMAVTKVDQYTRELMAQQLPKQTYSETAIGKALLESIKMLQWRSPEGAVIILITDGEENIHPSISAVLPMVIKSKVIVNTIAIG
ncbi:Calcium-activated chloride channel regulator 1 [Nymphon striatum]|nr:Calcium-activated chloride channel regulator 1 [Nymphon striatum]